MPLIDNLNTALSDREILLLVNEGLNNLNNKVDDIRTDNACKFDTTSKTLGEHQKSIDKLNRWQYMELGALIIISVVMSWIVQLVY